MMIDVIVADYRCLLLFIHLSMQVAITHSLAHVAVMVEAQMVLKPAARKCLDPMLFQHPTTPLSGHHHVYLCRHIALR